ncbi:phage tail protein [Actinoplanes sp. NPDC026670]|uniref:phage tail protein n=1 Tax=Actinoplanes sp. NPDC026670 TaxID=3154700 RepID=UPI00340097F7
MTQPYPLPRFQFQVHWGPARLSFTEVTGLVLEREKIEYRHSDSQGFNRIAMPGLLKNNHITLKSGKFIGDIDVYLWFDAVTTERVAERREVLITMLNERQLPVAAWKALRCFPVKITAPDLKSDANEVAIESMEIAHEGLSRADP